MDGLECSAIEILEEIHILRHELLSLSAALDKLIDELHEEEYQE